MKIHLLDMGRPKYGDCLLLLQDDQKILIDGGHPGDSVSIRRQLSKLLGTRPPFDINLLIVTHCHADHIGCLPDLVKAGDLIPQMALVADENFGWGSPTAIGEQPDAVLSDNQEMLFLALQEEERLSLSDEELEQFLYDAALLKDTYKEMLRTLEQKGTQVIRYEGSNLEDIKQIEAAAASFRLKVIGPTKEHLQLCADAIGKTLGDGRSDLLSNVTADASPSSLLETYRSLASRFERDSFSGRFASDRPGVGAAKNNQSIVVTVQSPESDGSWKALLAGDMQFAKPEVGGLEPIMDSLLQIVNENGPYDFIKLTHHASYNGLDDRILENWNKHTKLFAHTGGWNDPTHPDGGVLRILETRANSKKLIFTRTDRNGIITVSKGVDGVLGMDISKGDFNDFSPNTPPDLLPAPAPITPTVLPLPVPQATPNNPVADFVEVIAKVPFTDTKVTLTIEVEPGKKKISDALNLRLDKAPFFEKDRFAGLLAITSLPKLAINTSSDLVQQVQQHLQNMGIELLDIPESLLVTVELAATRVRQRLVQGGIRGVLILGGYDLISPQKLDVLPSQLREELKQKNRNQADADDFIVWSDDIYGDVNGDGNPELPVSRIPDAKDPQLMLTALNVPRFSIKNRFGVRNIARPFAQAVYQDIPGAMNAIEVSETFGPHNVPQDAASGAVYYMLHGSPKDGTKFWGETADSEDEFEAFCIDNVPTSALGTVVFTGCCWGALSAEPIAFRKTSSAPLQPRKIEQSIALKYLQAGALAFVGNTGAHYSPRVEPYNYHGKPLHDTFWKGIREGKSPAVALFEAKLQYAKDLPHGETTPFSKAIEYKTFRQFTCLGLGW